MRRLLLVLALLLVVGGVAGIVAVGLANRDGGSAAIVEGGATTLAEPAGALAPVDHEPAPAIDGPAIDGKGQVSLAALRGHVVIVNFWGSWCDPCKREFPQLVAFAQAHPEVRILGVASEEASAEAPARFMREHGGTWPSTWENDPATGRRWKVIGYPSTFVVDGQGRIVARIVGPVTEASLAAGVARAA